MNYSEFIAAEKAFYDDFRKYNDFRKRFFRLYFKYYHRLSVTGIENIPDGPAIIVPNHGGAFDLDIVSLLYCAHPRRPIHPLIAWDWHYLYSTWGRYWVGGGIPLWTRGGLKYDYYDQYLLEGGDRFPGLICIFPEGNSGTARSGHNLRPFFPGVARLALRYRVPIVPAAMINFYRACPILMEIEKDHAVPDVIAPLWTFPVKLKIEFGRPFELREYYGRTYTKEEEYWIANEVIRSVLAEVIRRHVKCSLLPFHGAMKAPSQITDV